MIKEEQKEGLRLEGDGRVEVKRRRKGLGSEEKLRVKVRRRWKVEVKRRRKG